MARSTPFQKKAGEVRKAFSEARKQRATNRVREVQTGGGQFGDVEFPESDAPTGIVLWEAESEASGTIEHPTFRAKSVDGVVYVACLVNGVEVFEQTVSSGDTRLGDRRIFSVSKGDKISLVARANEAARIEQAGLFFFFREM